jgi:hypothetical protein
LSPSSMWLEASHFCSISSNASIMDGARATEVLDRLGPLVEDSKKHFNPSYRVKGLIDYILEISSVCIENVCC